MSSILKPLLPRVNFGYKITEDLVFDAPFFEGNGNSPLDIITYNTGAFLYTPTWQNGLYGKEINIGSAGSTNGIQYSLLPFQSNIVKFSIEQIYYVPSGLIHWYAPWYLGQEATGGAGGRAYVEVNGNPGVTLGFVVNAATSGGFSIPIPTTGQYHHQIITYDFSNVATAPNWFLDGQQQTVTTATTPSGTMPSDNGVFTIGNDDVPATDAEGWPGPIVYTRFYKRQLQLEEVKKLYRDPFYIYKPRVFLPKHAGTVTASASGGTRKWSDTNSWVGGAVPTASDDALLTSTSGNIEIDSGAVCNSLNCTGFTGTLTHDSGVTLTIGSSTAGLSNVALTLVSGMTYTLNSVTTSAISFISTSSTQQTIDYGGKNAGNITINGAGSNYAFISGITTNAAATITLTTGSLHTDGTSDNSGLTHSWGLFNSNNSNTRTLTLGTSNITINGSGATTWNVQTSTGLTLSAASTTINLVGTTSTFGGVAGTTYGTLNLTMAGQGQFNGNSTFTNFNRTSTGLKTDSLKVVGNITVTSTLTLAGNSAINRLFVFANIIGTQQTITNTGATMTISNTDFQDIAMSTTWDASARTDIGDCGGNSGITFPASVQQTCTMSSNQNWSSVGIWTSRIPLPQDDIVMTGVTGGTLTSDMPRLGRSIDWTGATGSPTWSFASTANSIYGSITLILGMTLSGTQGLTLGARSAYTITSAGKTFPQAVTVNAPGATYTVIVPFATTGSLSRVHGVFSYTDGLSDSISLTETLVRSTTKVFTNTLTLTETIAKQTNKFFTETALSLTETLSTLHGHYLSFVDNLTLTESITRNITKVFSDSVSLTETLVRSTTKVFSDSVSLTETLVRSTTKVFTETTLSLTETFTKLTTKTLTETATLTESFIRYTTKAFTDSVTLAETFSKQLQKVFSESALSLSDSITKLTTKVLTETLSLIEIFTHISTFYRTFIDTITLTDSISKFTSRTFTESISLIDTIITSFVTIVTLASPRIIIVDGILAMRLGGIIYTRI